MPQTTMVRKVFNLNDLHIKHCGISTYGCLRALAEMKKGTGVIRTFFFYHYFYYNNFDIPSPTDFASLFAQQVLGVIRKIVKDGA